MTYPYVFANDVEQVCFSLYKANNLAALASKVWLKWTLTLDKVRGENLNGFFIYSFLESEDTLNKVHCFQHAGHLFLSYNGITVRVIFRLGGEQHPSATVKSEIRFLTLDSLSFNNSLKWLGYEYPFFSKVVFVAPFKFPSL